MRPTRDEYYLAMARLVASRATCLRRQVGCVLVDARGHVLATGYNGVAAGLPHCNEPAPMTCPHCRSMTGEKATWPLERVGVEVVAMRCPVCLRRWPEHPHACAGAWAPSGTNLDGCQAIHAEQNALLQCRDVYAVETCYCTTAPCLTCVKLLMNTGCRHIVCAEGYPQAAEASALWVRSLAEGRGARTWVGPAT